MKVLRPGQLEYAKALELQRDLVRRRISGEIDDTLVLLEHTPTVVSGRSGHAENVLVDPEYLARRGIAFTESDRGGDVTYHGPGQLVAYPIVDLRAAGRDIHLYLRNLEEAIMGVLGDFGIEPSRRAGQTGVWAGTGKIASIGIAVRNWVAFHGFAINVCNDLGGFTLINPCGVRGGEVTSMSRVLGRPVTVLEVASGIVRHLEASLYGRFAAVS